MEHLDRLSGIGAILLSATALTACYEPPPPAPVASAYVPAPPPAAAQPAPAQGAYSS